MLASAFIALAVALSEARLVLPILIFMVVALAVASGVLYVTKAREERAREERAREEQAEGRAPVGGAPHDQPVGGSR